VGDVLIEMFRCYICGKYKNSAEIQSVMIRDMLFRKDICSQCKDQLSGVKSELTTNTLGAEGTEKKTEE